MLSLGTVVVVLKHKDGQTVELTVPKHDAMYASVVRRNGRFYMYIGPYQGNFEKILFREISQPVELE